MEDLNQQLISAARDADLEAVQRYLASGADAKFRDDQSGTGEAKTALTVALQQTHGAKAKAAKEVILALVAAGADVNAVRAQYDWRGCGISTTAFEMLLKSNLASDPAILEAFLQAGANPNAKRVDVRHRWQ